MDFEIIVGLEIMRMKMYFHYEFKERSYPNYILNNINEAWEYVKGKYDSLNFDDIDRNYNSPLYRFEHCVTDKDTVRIYLANTSYKEYYGTNISHPEIVNIYGEGFLANPLAVCGLIISLDNKILLFQRSNRVLDRPGFWHTVGGHLPRLKEKGNYKFGAEEIEKKLFEELTEEFSGLDIKPTRYLPICFVKDKITRKSELCFIINSSLTVDNIIDNLKLNYEHTSEILILPAEVDILCNFLVKNSSQVVFSTQAILFHYCILESGIEMPCIERMDSDE